MKIWVLNTCIPRESVPCQPNLFTSEAAAFAEFDKMMRLEWSSNGPTDDEGDPLPYPDGDPQAAHDAIAGDNGEEWGQWELTWHDVPEPSAPTVAEKVYVGVVDSDGGTDLYAARTQEDLDRQMAKPCRELWAREMPEPMPATDSEIVAAWFDHQSERGGDQWRVTQEITLEPAPPMTVDALKAAVLALPEDERWRIKWDLDIAQGSLPLVTIAASDILECMNGEGYAHPKLKEWAERAAYRVYSKHDGSAELHGAAVDWGRDLVLEYAREECVDLKTAEEIYVRCVHAQAPDAWEGTLADFFDAHDIDDEERFAISEKLVESESYSPEDGMWTLHVVKQEEAAS